MLLQMMSNFHENIILLHNLSIIACYNCDKFDLIIHEVITKHISCITYQSTYIFISHII